MKRVGVIAVQGAVSEHQRALADCGAEGIAVRTPTELESVDAVILPGGESTTISRLLRSSGLEAPLRQRAGRDLALLGTCAGMILLSSQAQHDVADKDVHLLGLLDAEVDRNAFGRQRESFEAQVELEGMGAMPAVFIRAPALSRVWGETDALATLADGRIIAARKGTVMATAFHPELTPDRRVHQWLVDQA